MTMPNIEELMALADRYATLRIGEGTANARKELHDAMQSQAERIAELERESETHAKAYGLAIVERDNLRHELKVAQEGWRCECSTDDACRFARERDALRAELATIAAAEPHYWECKGSLYQSKINDDCEPLFTRPMPAQNVTELVEALEKLARLGNGEHYGNSDGNMIARMALSRYKGAK